jgi:hypothetical protein
MVGALTIGVGCGYGFGPRGNVIPSGAHTISIALFKNETRERALEVALRTAIEEEFRRRGVLQVVDHDADLRLEGQLRRLRNVPVAFAGADQAVEFQAQLVVGLRLVDARTGKVLLNTKQVQETADFGAVRNVIISSSPSFQEETTDARDLAQLTSVALSESNRDRARRRLVEQMAQQVYLITVEGF